ncbi:MAG TPA: hypothetical protein VFM10_09725 [Terriglobales bacterium]|nr:hypothetical protein [Terriglobales bacterium]
MSDSATERMIELQKQLRIRLAELGFDGVSASNVVHRFAEISVLANDLADKCMPLLLEMSPEHRDALLSLVAHIKWDMDEIKDAITDLEPDITELMNFLQR